MPESSKCDHRNPDEVKFCLKCSRELMRCCPTCGQPAADGSKYCIRCGMRLPDSAFRPQNLRAKPGQIRGLTGSRGPGVGREDALRQLGDTPDRILQDGHSGMTRITGEADVGKSRLAAELRLTCLPKDLRDALQKAAVIGPSFPVSLVARLNGFQRRAITAQLSALEARGFLVDSPFGEEAGYAFRNDLVQEVVYGTLPRRDREKLHEQIGRLIEGGAYWPLDERTETIAYHYVRSADPSLAVPYLIAAGKNAARRCAYEAAIQHYRQALAHMPKGDSFYSEQFARVQLGLGQALKFVGEFREAAEILEKATQHLLRQSLGVDSISLLRILLQGLRELADIRLREGSPDEAVAHLRADPDAVGDEGVQNSR